MSLLLLYSKIKKIEHETGKLYSFISKKIAHLNGALAQLFVDLAQEENIHEKQVDMAQRIIIEAREGLAKGDALQELDRILSLIEEKKSSIEKKEQFSTDELINLEERHHWFYVEIQNPEIKSLFRSLSGFDQAHINKLKKFIQD